MRIMLAVLGVCILAGTAAADKLVQEPLQLDPDIECSFDTIERFVNFGAGPSGGTAPNVCDPGGGNPVWEWGVPVGIPAPPVPYGPNVWGTVLAGDYGNDSGDALGSPLFLIEVGLNELVEFVHYFDFETDFDGGNIAIVEVPGGEETVVAPIGGYPGTISESTAFYAWCVDSEEGWSGSSGGWRRDCFDLSAWDGQLIRIRSDFGSDSSVTRPGWYFAGATHGSAGVTPIDQSTWGQIKNVYR